MNWIESELATQAVNDESLKINWLKWNDKEVKSIVIDFTEPFIKEKDNYDKLQAKVPIKEGDELKVWGIYPINPIYKELLEAGKLGKTKFKILMQKMKTSKGTPGNAFTILESS